MSHHHHGRFSHNSQEKKFRHIQVMRHSKRWLKRLLAVVAVLLALAVALSYVLINKEKEPGQLEVPEKGFHGIF